MLEPILSIKDDNCNENRVIWESVDEFWFRIRIIQFSLGRLESYLFDFGASYTNSGGVESLERFVECMLRLLNDQFADCNCVLAQLDLYQSVEDLEDSNSDLVTSGGLDVASQLEVVDGLVWKNTDDVSAYQMACKAVETGRRYVEDVIRFLEAFSFQYFFENSFDE